MYYTIMVVVTIERAWGGGGGTRGGEYEDPMSYWPPTPMNRGVRVLLHVLCHLILRSFHIISPQPEVVVSMFVFRVLGTWFSSSLFPPYIFLYIFAYPSKPAFLFCCFSIPTL